MILLGISASAQEPFYRKSLTNFKVENLSPDQLSTFQQQLSQSKMTEQEMVKYLLSKGMSIDEISKLRFRIMNQQTIPGSLNKTGIDQLDLLDLLMSGKDSTDLELLDSLGYFKSRSEEEKMIFGSELFLNSKMGFASDMQLATPTNYIIGPKDVLSLTLFGYQELSSELKVLPDGRVNIPYAGMMAVGGLTIEQATLKIRDAMQRSGYASLRTGQTKLQLSVSQYRTFPVTVIGAKASGTYMVSSVANAFHALYQAKGPARRGSYRDIELIRKGEIIQKIDLYSFIVDGNQKQFLNLQENDIINIPAYDHRVTMKGEVKTTGYFEMKEGETFSKLLKYSGGFTPVAYQERIYIEKVSKNEFVSRDIEKPAFDSYQPGNGDVVYVGSIVNRNSQRVAIGGAIMRPGYYGLHDSLTVGKLIKRAGGVKESSLMTRGLIYRAGHDHQISYLRFNPGEILAGKNDLVLSDGDSVVIADRAVLFPKEIITVTGEVNKPGYFIYGEKMTVLDAILLSGGLTESSLPSKIEIARRVDGNNDFVISQILESSTDRNLMLQAQELELKPQDFVIVRKNPNYVPQRKIELTGQFKFPGTYILSRQREYLSEVIERAGGFNDLADDRYVLIYRKQINPFFNKMKEEIETKETEVENEFSLVNTKTKKTNPVSASTINSADSLLIDTISVSFKNLRSEDKTKFDIYLQEGDVINVLQFQNTVSLKGEVNNKVIVNHSSTQLRTYLRDAGGLTRFADPRRIYVIHADGSSSATTRFLGLRFYPKVVPGSVVMVPLKHSQEERVKDPSRMAATASILASTTGLIFALINLIK
jgi:protein involved in polysaccharide export with SLBB domain